MLRTTFIRMLMPGLNLTSAYRINTYKSSKCICRIISSESAIKLNFDKQSNDVRNENFTRLLQIANTIGLDTKRFTNLFNNNNNAVTNIDSEQFLKNSKILLNFGFENDTLLTFIEECPNVFHTKSDELDRLLNLWQQLPIGEQLILELLSKHPQFIEIIGPVVTERFRILVPYFEKEKTVAILLINAPRVIYESWETLKEKLDFLHSHNIPMKKIASCNALELSLLEMKTRFMFLERAGVYKKRIDLFKKDLKSKNPSVRNILCSSDELFAKTIANLTLAEYEAFSEIYRFEQQLLDEGTCEEDSE